MDLFAQAQLGIRAIDVDDAAKEQALKYLEQWLTEPGFAGYRPQLHWLIEQKQWTGLLDRFYQILPFGTGGRRGPVGIGPNRMNPWTLTASVQGHCEYLRERFPGVHPLRVVVVYDVRRFEDKRQNYNPKLPNPVLHLTSKDFCHQAIGVYVANGIHACTLPPDSTRYLATPELSFIIRELNAHGGLNISASHNPPDDNGGKFYDERGGQPCPPDDQIMADLVDQVKTIKTLPWADAVRGGRVQWLDESLHDRYIELGRKQSLVPPPRFDEIKVVYTPLHGVGAHTAMEVLVKQGFRVVPVEEQMTPDGLFPNVTLSPNPEVPESFDRALATAKQNDADLALATDPDADRLGAMVLDQQKNWRYLTGNELCCLLTHFKLSKLAQQGRMPASPVIIESVVTTSLVTRIAHHFGAQCVDSLLVGFKYVADVLWHLEKDGKYEDVRATPQDFVLACEESHGILLTPRIRDKDAAGASLLMAELTLEQKRQGKTVLDYLEAIYRQFGYFRNEGVQIVMTGILGKKNMARMLDLLRASPPKEIAGLTVTEYEDLRDENGRMGPFKGATDYAARNFLIFRLGEHGRVMLRPSGTEPKAKTYLELRSPPCKPGTPADEWQRIRRGVDEQMQRLATEFQRHALGLVGMELPTGGVKLSR
jgi:phosphoglucomutase